MLAADAAGGSAAGGPAEAADEVALTGGNTSSVIRVGDTVRRQVRPWTPAVHALLRHLDRAAFDGAPRVLGIDQHGREVLSYLDGETAVYPLNSRWTAERTMVAAATLLRRFHDAQAGFVPPADARWWSGSRPAAEVVAHNDVAPYNTILRPDGRLAMIDFDTAGPAPRAWDVAFAAWCWVPLRCPDSAVADGWPAAGLDVPGRLRRFVDAYRLPPGDRARLLDTVRARIVDHVAELRRLAATGEPAFVRLVTAGYADRHQADVGWLDSHRAEWAAALA